jgi:hypothetical protein
MKDVVCSKCQHKGHIAANCTSAYTTAGKFIGKGVPPAGHYWTKRHEAENLKAKKPAMVKKTPPRQQQQQQQQQQKKKRTKTVGGIKLVEPLLVPPIFAPVLDAKDNSEISEFSDCDEYFSLDERTVSLTADKTNISEHVATSSKPSVWDVDSDDLDLQKWKIQKNKRRVPKTYSESLKGSAPGSSANPREPLKFVKKNLVRR